MKFLDLFAGIGGFHLGMQQAGHKCVGYIEWDKFARQSYQAIFNTKGLYNGKDIKSVKGSELPKADVWCFGSPCQDISVAGKQQGIKGEQSSMFFEVIRLLKETDREKKPSYLFMENVKNLLSSQKGWDFTELLYQMDKVGYDVQWSVINSSDVVPQNRERAFIIGYLRGRSTRKVFPIIGKNGETNKTIKVIGNTSRTGFRGQDVSDPTGISTTLLSRDYKGPKQVAIKQVGNISSSKSFGGNPQVGRVYSTDGISPTLSTMQGGGREPKILDDQGRTKKRLKPLSISPTLRSQSHGNEPKIAIPVLTPDRVKKRQNGHRFKTNGEPEFTLTGQDRHGVLVRNIKKYAYNVRPNAHPAISITPIGNIRGHKQDYKKMGLSELQFTNPQNVASTVTTSHCPKTWTSDLRIRKLTPRECWRLQGFPDWAFDRAKKAGLSDSQLYKQAGNAVTVPVIQAIAERFK